MTERERARIDALSNFQGRIGYSFKNKEFLEEALTHSSYAHEHGLRLWNERLEFLGDAVLELLVSEQLFRSCPGVGEGQMTRERSALVREEALTAWGRSLGIDKLLRAGKGQRDNVGANMIGDAVEALIGALYLDGGLKASRDFVQTRPEPKAQVLDAKSRLQILFQENNISVPRYELLSREGPDHAPSFLVAVLRADEEIARGRGSNRKNAEQEAAKNALEQLERKDAPIL